MRKTADFIEEQKSAKQSRSKSKRTPQNRRFSGVKKTLRGGHDPAIGKATQFAPGKSPNPGGRPNVDVAAEIARAVLEGNRDAAIKALARALLKGNAYVFKELAERGYGKVSQEIVVSGAVEIAERLKAARKRVNG